MELVIIVTIIPIPDFQLFPPNAADWSLWHPESLTTSEYSNNTWTMTREPREFDDYVTQYNLSTGKR